jgi:hypothetical protein
VVTKLGSETWSRQPSVFLAAAFPDRSLVSDLARCWYVEHPSLNVTRSCHQLSSAWMWIVTTEMTVPKLDDCDCTGTVDGCFDALML